ncbi:Sister chromatid cohesion protein PDS5 A-A [Araneus ventricosus]|uniref:Sister chromatid cohesion protein PDS5 A-A n=1 Tax=Araneus ventricosus TaxID=182803 RepID=A0A4Y2GC02_ARAVE|nr:Sister chromatid cohesion protein PDS5 A-A [Araneus ventricosus]
MESIVYPPGVRDLSEDISTDDLVRRLKECAQAFQSMAQDEENAHRYEPLAHLLISERFLEHKSRDVHLLVACCIADIFRVSAPDAPYKDEKQIKMLLEFFIDQLEGLRNPDNPAFKRYFYLLENLSVVKTFNICFDLEDCQITVCRLFKQMFKIINDHQFLKLQRIIVDLLCPLINEADVIPAGLINIIFNHIIDPKKTDNKNACILAQEILRKTSSSIGTYVQAYFTNEFYLGKPVSKRLCDLIYELHFINCGMMAFVIPQLEGKLKSSDEEEREIVTEVVARMFSDKKSNMIEENKSLWTSFLARFNDISAKVRLCCVQYVNNFLLYHPESETEVTELLRQRYHDTDEDVRLKVTSTIFSAAKENIKCINDTILFHMKERMLDTKFRIRKESLLGVAKLYKQYVLDSEYVDPATEKLLSFVKDKVLYNYYQSTLEDKFLVERILHTCLVPYQTCMEKRMKLLYQFYCTIDDRAARAFKEILRNQKHMRSLTIGLLEIIQQKRSEKKKLLEAKIKTIARSKQVSENATLSLNDRRQIKRLFLLVLLLRVPCHFLMPKLVELCQTLAKDRPALSKLKMERTAATIYSGSKKCSYTYDFQ